MCGVGWQRWRPRAVGGGDDEGGRGGSRLRMRTPSWERGGACVFRGGVSAGVCSKRSKKLHTPHPRAWPLVGRARVGRARVGHAGWSSASSASSASKARKHWRLLHARFLHPGPPNRFLSRQLPHSPHSCRMQPAHAPHRYLTPLGCDGDLPPLASSSSRRASASSCLSTVRCGASTRGSALRGAAAASLSSAAPRRLARAHARLPLPLQVHQRPRAQDQRDGQVAQWQLRHGRGGAARTAHSQVKRLEVHATRNTRHANHATRNPRHAQPTPRALTACACATPSPA